MQTTSVNTERMASRAAVIANVRGYPYPYPYPYT